MLRKVDINTVLGWLKDVEGADYQSFTEPEFTVQKLEFVPFLLNFLREQSSQVLTNGPATPAKTPSHPRPAARTQGFSDKLAGRSTSSGAGSRSASRVQLFSPAPSVSPGSESEAAGPSGLSGVSAFSSPSFSSTRTPSPRLPGSERRCGQRVSLGDYMFSPPENSPNHQSHKGRKKGGGSTAVGGQLRHEGGRGDLHSNEAGRWEAGGRRSARGVGGGHTRMGEQVSPPFAGQLNLNNLEDFPPVGSSPISPATSKPSRRINPTPVSGDRPHSKPKTCFTSTPFQKASSPLLETEASDGLMTAGSSMRLKEERELLKREKTKRAQQVASPLLSALDPCTPTKTGARTGSKVTSDMPTSPEPSKVTFSSELDVLVELYCTCISENLVPNIFLELFFVMQLLTSWAHHTHDNEEQKSLCAANTEVLERCYLRQVHNCVYFAVKVLENQFQLIAHLDKCTLRLLAENERVACFSPDLRDRLTQAQDRSTAKLSPSASTFIHSVPFQPATDNRSNFFSDKAFHTFKKQRDVFYEVLREWEDLHKEPGWSFDAALGGRIRGIMSQLTSAGNHSHFARLFLKQLVQVCKGPRPSSSSVDAADADLLGMLGADSLGRLKRLEERLIQPHGVVGPCPPPSFPGHQEFFRDFIQTASCCQLNQHLQDSLCQQLLQLDEVSILSPADEKQRFSSVLLLARLLAKFLGFISFFPYQTSGRPSRDIQETSVALRSKVTSLPVLDVCAVLNNSIRRKRTILTVPWLVEFLSMLDFIGPLLLCYRTTLGSLLLLYRKLQLNRSEEMCYLNKLLLVSVLGWLFQVRRDTRMVQLKLGINALCLVSVCSGEFRKLLAAFVSGSTARSGGIIRKITPTSAELKDTPTAMRSQQKLQVDLEQAFFHNQPPSLRRTVEFVAERVGSNAVKHMKATLVRELVERGEKMLRDGLESPNSNASMLNESICARLCEAGLEALAKATKYCDEKSPEAIRVLLPDETTPTVKLSWGHASKMTLCLLCEALVRREWRSKYDRVIKVLGSPKQGSERVMCCPPHCKHNSPLPSDILIEIKVHFSCCN
uniref:Codanin 1 n=1 Tax=Nothobranchius furzeri TaxID=105023 RepID=A0A8C6Q8M9_NOTFU